MPAGGVVKSFDVIEHIGSCLVSGPVDLVGSPFGLERGEEALHRGIVPDVAERLIDETTPLSGIDRPNRSRAQLLALTVNPRTLNA